jgi:Fe-Mn family superoxide dismutase
MAEYTLPDLPYDYAALAPHISARIMELHHDKHHAAYVAGANTALAKLAEARESADYANLPKLEKDLAFHLGGHINHSIFWKNLSPDGGDKPTGDLAAAIDDNFGSFDKFVAHFSAAALGLQGSGWAVLSWDPVGKQLIIQQMFDQQGNTALGDYVNVKADYVKAFWNIANWADAQARFEASRSGASLLLLLS